MTAGQLQVDNTLSVDATKLALSKDGIFQTIQGEGPRLGRNTVFLRLAGCNLACSWCDTSYTWDWTGRNGFPYQVKEEVKRFDVFQVARDLLTFNPLWSLTITGGEPMLQWRALDFLFGLLPNGLEINFETNGTIWPEWSTDTIESFPSINYVVSPKLGNSGNSILNGSLQALLNFKINGADFKFVCKSVDDFKEIDLLEAKIFNLGFGPIPAHKIWVMPEGVQLGLVNSRAQEMASEVIRRGWNLTTRFHQQLWGNTRAR